MKKTLLLAVMFVGVASMTSCKKDRDCECTIAGETTVTTLSDVNKSDAEDICSEASTVAAILGGSCELK
jgi:hypothetical protein